MLHDQRDYAAPYNPFDVDGAFFSVQFINRLTVYFRIGLTVSLSAS